MPKLAEKPPKETVVVEPDLPVKEPAPTPAGPAEQPPPAGNPETPTSEGAGSDIPPDAPTEDPDVIAGFERLKAVGVVNTFVDDVRRDYLRMVGAMSSTEPVFVAGARAPRLKVGAYTLQPGEIVPGAQGWARRESYERLGRIERR